MGHSRLKSWREPHGLSGGETNADSEVVEETLRNAGATVMGRRMFSGGEGPWEDDPNADAWWGDDPPFHHPVFILTHHAREPVTKQGGTTFTFVTDGIEAALEQASAAAGDKTSRWAAARASPSSTSRPGCSTRSRSTSCPCSSATACGCSRTSRPDQPELECTRVVEAPGVTHLRYRVVK